MYYSKPEEVQAAGGWTRDYRQAILYILKKQPKYMSFKVQRAEVYRQKQMFFFFFPLVWWHIMQQSETWTQSTKLSFDFEQQLVKNTHFYQLNLELSHLCSLTDLCDHTFHFGAVNNCQHAFTDPKKLHTSTF